MLFHSIFPISSFSYFQFFYFFPFMFLFRLLDSLFSSIFSVGSRSRCLCTSHSFILNYLQYWFGSMCSFWDVHSLPLQSIHVAHTSIFSIIDMHEHIIHEHILTPTTIYIHTHTKIYPYSNGREKFNRPEFTYYRILYLVFLW